jgi:hypothetical protein
MRLTDDRTYLQVKANVDALRSNGFEVSISDLRYIKLAEFERYEEKRKSAFESLVVENAALRLQLKELTEMNNRLREALQRQSLDRYEYE